MLLPIFSSIFFLLGVRATLLSATVITVPVTCREAFALDGCNLRMHMHHKASNLMQTKRLSSLSHLSVHTHLRNRGCMHACIITAYADAKPFGTA